MRVSDSFVVLAQVTGLLAILDLVLINKRLQFLLPFLLLLPYTLLKLLSQLLRHRNRPPIYLGTPVLIIQKEFLSLLIFAAEEGSIVESGEVFWLLDLLNHLWVTASSSIFSSLGIVQRL